MWRKMIQLRVVIALVLVTGLSPAVSPASDVAFDAEKCGRYHFVYWNSVYDFLTGLRVVTPLDMARAMFLWVHIGRRQDIPGVPADEQPSKLDPAVVINMQKVFSIWALHMSGLPQSQEVACHKALPAAIQRLGQASVSKCFTGGIRNASCHDGWREEPWPAITFPWGRESEYLSVGQGGSVSIEGSMLRQATGQSPKGPEGPEEQEESVE